MTLTLPDWLFDGIVMKGGVLTIHEDYFLLTGGIERWLYRVARKHAGQQEAGWQFTMRQLYEKSGLDLAVLRLRHRRPQGRRGGFAAGIHVDDPQERGGGGGHPSS